MRVHAYCCKSFENITRKAAGVQPLTCPPATIYNLDVAHLAACDLLYIDLHGRPGETFWLGDNRTLALTTEQVRQMDLRNTIVFALSCYLADQESPTLDALLDAGARYVIGGDGQNWAGPRTLWGASLLGLWFRRLLGWGVPPLRALAWAKRRVRLSAVKRSKRLASKDTLEFRAYYREAT